tara:strand:- start:2235 stop:3458 length:1224 start_codon:yes stop_codon:yes gene_type:complete
MKYEDFQSILDKKFGASRPADIAKEFNVTPQVVNAWKLKDQVPYKYIKAMRKKLSNMRIVNKQENSNFSHADDDTFGFQIVFDYSRKIYNHKYHILILSVIMMTLFYCHNKFIAEDVYLSHSKMIPFRSGENSGLGSIAGQLGLNLGSSGGSVGELALHSSHLVPEIIVCNRVLKKVLLRKFKSENHTSPRSLISLIYKSDNDSENWSAHRIQRAVSIFKKSVEVKKSRSSPIIRLHVKASEALLAAEINNALIEETEKFMKNSKISKISEKKVFISNRLKEVGLDLADAENKLKTFRENNRSIISSPALALKQERLFREVQVQTEVFITLKNQYEIAQIDEVNDPKIIEVLNYPEKPIKRISPGSPAFSLLLGLVFGIILGTGFVIVKDLKDEYWVIIQGLIKGNK